MLLMIKFSVRKDAAFGCLLDLGAASVKCGELWCWDVIRGRVDRCSLLWGLGFAERCLVMPW